MQKLLLAMLSGTYVSLKVFKKKETKVKKKEKMVKKKRQKKEKRNNH